jgi:hypothetical protein
MLITFGCSWPFNIAKSLKSKTTLGKSLYFELIIEVGYCFGIAAHLADGELNYVLSFYILDICLVATDMFLYFRNRALDREREVRLNHNKA